MSFVTVRINIVKALQEPEVYNPIVFIRSFGLRLPKDFTVIVTAEASLWTLLLRLMCSLSETTPWELCCWLRLLGGPSAVLTGTTLPKKEVAIAVTGHYHRTREKKQYFLSSSHFISSFIASHWLSRKHEKCSFQVSTPW